MERQARRAQVLRHAKRIFARKGYHRTNVADIISRARIARGTFYLYFQNKKDLFEALLEQVLTDILLNHSTGFDRYLDAKILKFYDRIAALIQRSLDLGIEMQLVRQSDTRAISYCILGAIKEVVGLLSRGGETNTDRLVEEILDFGLRGVARPELLATVAQGGDPAREPVFLFRSK